MGSLAKRRMAFSSYGIAVIPQLQCTVEWTPAARASDLITVGFLLFSSATQKANEESSSPPHFPSPGISKISEGNIFSGHHDGPKARCSLFQRLLSKERKGSKTSNKQNLEVDFLYRRAKKKAGKSFKDKEDTVKKTSASGTYRALHRTRFQAASLHIHLLTLYISSDV